MAVSHAFKDFFKAQCHYHQKMTLDRTPQAADKYIVRFPDGMRDRLAQAAKQNNRSMNAEVVARLQASFDLAPAADGAAAQELAESRAQTITAMEFLQGSLCETVVAMYASLPSSQKRDRTIANAQRLAESLLAGVQPGDYLMSKSELLAANPALAHFLEEVEDNIKSYQKKEARSGRTNTTKR
jgi:hypothetical protein